jgi:hypothetical protein
MVALALQLRYARVKPDQLVIFPIGSRHRRLAR